MTETIIFTNESGTTVTLEVPLTYYTTPEFQKKFINTFSKVLAYLTERVNNADNPSYVMKTVPPFEIGAVGDFPSFNAFLDDIRHKVKVAALTKFNSIIPD